MKKAAFALSDRDYTAIWMQAALYRTKTLPRLEKFLGKEASSDDVETRLKSAFANHNDQRVKNGKR